MSVEIREKIKRAEGSYVCTRVKGVDLVDTYLSRSLTLASLRSPLDRPYLIERLKLTKSIDKIDSFYERLNRASLEVLKEVSLFSLQCVEPLGIESSEVWDALMYDKELMSRPLRALQGKSCLRVLTLRINDLGKSPEEIRDWKPAEIRKKKVPPQALALLAVEQLENLDFSIYNGEEIDFCMRGGLDDRETIETRFLYLSESQIFQVLEKSSSKLLQFFPLECLERISVEKLKTKQIDAIFCSPWLSDEEQGERIRAIHPKYIRSMALQGSGKFLSFLTAEQLRGIELSSLHDAQVEEVFFLSKGAKEKISLLFSDEINQLIKRGFGKILEHVSSDQMQGVAMDLLSQADLEILFPSLEPRDLERGSYCEEEGRHFWIEYKPEGASCISMNETEVRRRLEERKQRCRKSFLSLNVGQWKRIQGKLPLVTRAFLGQK
jgi:hypothetical protein